MATAEPTSMRRDWMVSSWGVGGSRKVQGEVPRDGAAEAWDGDAGVCIGLLVAHRPGTARTTVAPCLWVTTKHGSTMRQFTSHVLERLGDAVPMAVPETGRES